MSKRQMEVLVDDIDGTPILDETMGRTVPINIDGNQVNLDLTNENIRLLEETFSRFIGAGTSSNSSSRSSSTEDLQVVRDWARRNGFKVKARGRIPFSVMDAFTKAHIASIRS